MLVIAPPIGESRIAVSPRGGDAIRADATDRAQSIRRKGIGHIQEA
jgi:hypothetical protein